MEQLEVLSSEEHQLRSENERLKNDLFFLQHRDRRPADFAAQHQETLVLDCVMGLLADQSPWDAVSCVFSKLASRVGLDACLYHALLPETDELLLDLWMGIPEEIAHSISRVRVGEGLFGIAAETRSPNVTHDIQHSVDPNVSLIRAVGMNACIDLPLIIRERLLGTLWLGSRTKAEFTPGELAFLQIVGKCLAIALERDQGKRALEQAVRKSQEAHAAKDRLLASLSHDLRTPLNPALLIVSALEHDETLDSDLRDQIGLVRHNIETERLLLDDLLDFNRIISGKFPLRTKEVDIHELLTRALSTVRGNVAAKHLVVQLHLAATSRVVNADSVRIQQLFWNLLGNAVKFTPDGGSILIRTVNVDPQAIVIEIQDTGVGIAEEEIEKIFLPFEQSSVRQNHNPGGLGLGLAICKAIVELHGGSIAARSEGLGLGSVFTVRLPALSVATKPDETVVSAIRSPIKPLHILLVEDDANTRAILTRILSRDGHLVESVGNCETAVKAIEFSGAGGDKPFQVLISDLGLPDCSGLALVRKLKARVPALRSVAISGFGAAEDVKRSHEAGFNVHLTKPVHIEDLRQSLAA